MSKSAFGVWGSGLFVLACVTFGEDATAAQVRCGWSSGQWSAPRGSVVVTRDAESVIAAPFGKANLRYTHIMLSHGATVSHATRAAPEENGGLTPVFGRPLKTEAGTHESGNSVSTVKSGQPGASRINMGAVYAMMMDDEVRLYRRGDARASAVDSFLRGLATTKIIDANGSATAGGAVRLLREFDILGIKFHAAMPYSFYQFKDIGTNHTGTVSSDGVACSTFLAWASRNATGSTMGVRVIPQATVSSALQAVRDRTRAVCEDGLEGFEADLAGLGNACEKAGNQIADCMAGTNGGKCDNFGEEYKNPQNWSGGTTARVIAPDHIIGRDKTDEGSPWGSADAKENPMTEVTWSGERVYGCWISDDHF